MEIPKTKEEAKKLGFDSIKNFEMNLAGKVARGLKYKTMKEKAEFKGDTETIKWIDSQDSILEDIATYEDSLKPVAEEKPAEEEVKQTKSKKEK